jgi:hypothetical protein
VKRAPIWPTRSRDLDGVECLITRGRWYAAGSERLAARRSGSWRGPVLSVTWWTGGPSTIAPDRVPRRQRLTAAGVVPGGGSSVGSPALAGNIQESAAGQGENCHDCAGFDDRAQPVVGSYDGWEDIAGMDEVVVATLLVVVAVVGADMVGIVTLC